MFQKLSILIPAYNEANTIVALLEKVLAVELDHDISKELIVVNDCSSDGTPQVLEEFVVKHPNLDIKIFSHSVNQGKGAAIHTAIREASGDYAVVQDADLEYDPEEYNLLLKPIKMDSADMVIGSRFMGHHPHRILFFWHSIGNKFLTTLSNMFTNLNLTDMESCYKLFRLDLAQKLVLNEKRFGFEPEFVSKMSRYPGIKIYEVGISYYGRTYAEGKKINWKDGFRAIYCILKYGLFKLK